MQLYFSDYKPFYLINILFHSCGIIYPKLFIYSFYDLLYVLYYLSICYFLNALMSLTFFTFNCYFMPWKLFDKEIYSHFSVYLELFLTLAFYLNFLHILKTSNSVTLMVCIEITLKLLVMI